jgi:hypothetical protein
VVSVRECHVAIVAFEGLRPIDAVGPHEVICGARRVAADSGQALRSPEGLFWDWPGDTEIVLAVRD